jgi:hypothetical protein
MMMRCRQKKLLPASRQQDVHEGISGAGLPALVPAVDGTEEAASEVHGVKGRAPVLAAPEAIGRRPEGVWQDAALEKGLS